VTSVKTEFCYASGVEEKDYVVIPPGEITREEALAIAQRLVEQIESRRLLDEAEPPGADDGRSPT
jgi:hypothetical protein